MSTGYRDWVLPGKKLSIELSSYCQARCLMCPFEEFPYKNRSMSFELFKKCIDEGSKHGLEYIDICLMGDSLLDPGAKEKFDYVKASYPNMKVYASSTGMSAEPDFTCKYVDTLHVSFYGLDKETYERVHKGSVVFEKAQENIERILEKPKGKRPYVVMTFLLLPENENQLNGWINKWEPLADEVIVWKPHNWAGLHDSYPTKEELKDAKTCHRPMGGPLCVWVNGDVTPCCFSWDKSMVIGNVNEESLEEIYFGDKRKELQRIHADSLFFGCGKACEKCDQLFAREDALVYTNNGRITGQQIVSEDYVIRFDAD